MSRFRSGRSAVTVVDVTGVGSGFGRSGDEAGRTVESARRAVDAVVIAMGCRTCAVVEHIVVDLDRAGLLQTLEAFFDAHLNGQTTVEISAADGAPLP